MSSTSAPQFPKSNKLLPFHTTILKEIHDPATSELLLIARGLGLRKLVCTLLQLYETPEALVLLINANSEEQLGIGEELGLLGCRNPGLRIVGYEMPKKERQELYKRGGLISVTSQILVVDLLQSDIPTELITGIMVLHAEKVTPTSLEAFIVRLYREKNTAGFLKAFSDQPESFTTGMSPLKTIMKELSLRKVLIYPRFHQTVQESLERRRADVVELHQPMTELMTDIHHAIVQCMSATLAELKRCNTTLELDDFNLENSYFRSFDALVRRQLDPVWHKVGPKTRQLVADLTVLRNLINYLLTYDSLSFHSYLETIIQANTISRITGKVRQAGNQSPWLYMDAANIIFLGAKKRCYETVNPAKKKAGKEGKEIVNLVSDGEDDVEEIVDEDEWDALDEAEGLVGRQKVEQKAGMKKRKKWLPSNIEPTLEELPKWSLVADVLLEIEEEILKRPVLPTSPGTNTVLLMVSSPRVASDLREYLAKLNDEEMEGRPGAGFGNDPPKHGTGRAMMEGRLRNYLVWKASLAREKDNGNGNGKETAKEKETVSEAVRVKDTKLRERSAMRRRMRGGASASESRLGSSAIEMSARHSGGKEVGGDARVEMSMVQEADDIASFLFSQQPVGRTSQNPIVLSEDVVIDLDVGEVTAEPDYDIHYGLVPEEETVVIRCYSDDSDDVMLAEIRPMYIVMVEPNQDFIRRIEVYRSSNPGLGVRVYFMLYHQSSEEHKYLAGLRKEKESFERLIKERGSMVLPIYESRAVSNQAEAALRVISTRKAGGSTVTDTPPQVIVDMREFRSTLPSLLHASHMIVIPATLTVGDYILSPDMCVERKSIPDLMSSFNSGRLYTQCELMSVHYKQPILLIEFEEHKSFSLSGVAEVKAQASKYTNSKYPTKKSMSGEDSTPAAASIQAKLVLLTLTFPRVRIIWSSSPYATAEIFRELKQSQHEPDPAKAILVGAEDDLDAAGAHGVNTIAEDLLRCFPGITAKNVGHVMSRIMNVRQLCEMSMSDVQELLGVEPGKACYEFIHRNK